MRKQSFAQSDSNFDGSASNKFIELAYKIADYASQAGCEMWPFHQASVPYFSSQSHEKKQEILASMQVFIEICQLTLANGKKLDDTKSLAWYGLKHLDMRFTSDLLDKIVDGDILEVYTNDNIQIFRNFKFFELISYTIEDIFCRPWTELFIRHDLQKARDTLAIMKKISTREINSTVLLEYLGAHKIEEALSPLRYQYDYTIKYLSPLYDRDHHPIGYIMIEAASILNPVRTYAEKELLLNRFYNTKSIDAQI